MTLFIQPAGPGVPNYSQPDTPGYGAYAQPYSATEEKLPGKSFSMDALIESRRFAAAREVTLRWAFDTRVPVSGKPWGMNFVFFGNHEGAVVPGAFKPQPVEAMKRLDVAWDADLRIGSGGASLLNDTFFKDAAGKSVQEWGVFGHASDEARAWAVKNKALGSFVSDGVTWQAYLSGTFVMVIPRDGDQLRCNMNLLAVRDFLKSKGLLPPGALFPSTCVGIEPALGVGSCRVGLTVNAG